MNLKQVVAAYRSEYLVQQGIRQLKGRSWSLTLLYLKCEYQIVGLIFLLSTSPARAGADAVCRAGEFEERRHDSQRHLLLERLIVFIVLPLETFFRLVLQLSNALIGFQGLT
jgi:hypothetical protein